GGNDSVYYSGYMTAGNRSRVSGQAPVTYDGYATIDGSSVYMSNGATAALYTYTPHFSGNQHFVQIFNAWFGSTQVSSLVRTLDDPTIYLVSGDTKYPIPDINTYNALYPLGGLSLVDPSYVNSLTTGQNMGRSFIAQDGTVYFVDAGIKLPFGTCSQVADYGYACGQLPQMTDYEVNALFDGPAMTNIFSTTSGKQFYVTGGTKREVYDQTTLLQDSIPSTANVLNEAAINNLPYGTPLMRDNTFVNSRTWGLYIYQNSELSPVDSSTFSKTILSSYTSYPWLDPQSIANLPSGPTVGSLVKVSGGSYYVITANGKYAISNPSDWVDSFVPVTQQVADQISGSQALSAPYLIRTQGSGTIYYLASQVKRPITSMDGVFKLANSTNPTILTLPDSYVNGLNQGAYLLAPGSLIKTPNDGTVYMIDGAGSKIPLSTFDPAEELGLNMNVNVFDKTFLDTNYPTANTTLSNTVVCQGNPYTAIGGTLYLQSAPYGSHLTLDNLSCIGLHTSQTPPSFLLGSDGTIYKVINGTKQPISSYNTYLSLSGNSSNTVKVSDYVLNGYQTGSSL
ncbi:MAG TPA: hypothetical protein VNZ45_18255, partial [Bacteroidia bacterium]|nr:hypothetical protein [Bacteroidia bacterium]